MPSWINSPGSMIQGLLGKPSLTRLTEGIHSFFSCFSAPHINKLTLGWAELPHPNQKCGILVLILLNQLLEAPASLHQRGSGVRPLRTCLLLNANTFPAKTSQSEGEKKSHRIPKISWLIPENQGFNHGIWRNPKGVFVAELDFHVPCF